MAKVCDKFDNVFLVDMTTYGPVYDAEMRADFAMGFHPNAHGLLRLCSYDRATISTTLCAACRKSFSNCPLWAPT